MKLAQSAIALAFCAAVTGNSVAAETEERWFQVEVLIFKNPAIETDNPESWPEFSIAEHPEEFIRLQGIEEILTKNSETTEVNGELAPPAKTIELAAPTSEGGLEAFVALSEFERQLIEQRNKLIKSPNYELLFHEAWNQPVPDRDRVIPIRIDAGERFGRQSELQGYLSLYVERYLHFTADLHLIEYKKSSDPFSLVADESRLDSGLADVNDFGGLSLLNTDSLANSQISRKSNQYFISVKDAHLQEKRRMRSKEIHYLDNPEFGLLILITPIEIK